MVPLGLHTAHPQLPLRLPRGHVPGQGVLHVLQRKEEWVRALASLKALLLNPWMLGWTGSPSPSCGQCPQEANERPGMPTR